MQKIWRPIISATFTLMVLIPIGLSAVPAYADTVGQHIAPTYIPKNSCDFYGVGTYSFYLLSPPEGVLQSGPSLQGPLSPYVKADAGVDVWNNTSCSNAQVKFSLQTKVCWFWGCHWREASSTSWMLLPISGEIARTLNADCRNGTNSYRIIGQISYAQLDFEQTMNSNWTPYLETKNGEYDGPEVKISC